MGGEKGVGRGCSARCRHTTCTAALCTRVGESQGLGTGELASLCIRQASRTVSSQKQPRLGLLRRFVVDEGQVVHPLHYRHCNGGTPQLKDLPAIATHLTNDPTTPRMTGSAPSLTKESMKHTSRRPDLWSSGRLWPDDFVRLWTRRHSPSHSLHIHAVATLPCRASLPSDTHNSLNTVPHTHTHTHTPAGCLATASPPPLLPRQDATPHAPATAFSPRTLASAARLWSCQNHPRRRPHPGPTAAVGTSLEARGPRPPWRSPTWCTQWSGSAPGPGRRLWPGPGQRPALRHRH